jgi:hypothetical protein
MRAVSKTCGVVLATAGALLAGPLLAAPAGASPIVACGSTITASASLTTDLNCSDDGVTIGADNVVLRLNGHAIHSTTGTGRGVIVDAQAGAVVTGPGTISGFAVGVVDVAGSSSSFEVRQVKFLNDTYVSRPSGETSTFRSVNVLGPNGFGPHAVGTVSVVGSSLVVSTAVAQWQAGQLTFDHSHLFGGSVGFLGRTLTLTDSQMRNVSIGCTQGVVQASGNLFLDSTLGLFQCEGSVVAGNGFLRQFAGSSAAINVREGAAPNFPDTRIEQNIFVGATAGVFVGGPVTQFDVTRNIFWANQDGMVVDCGGANICTQVPITGSASANLFLANSGEGLRVRDGSWHVGSNVAVINGGLGIDVAGTNATPIDDGGNRAMGNAAPQCVGVACS